MSPTSLLLSSITTFLALFGRSVHCTFTQSQAPLLADYGVITADSPKNVIVQMFEWTWDSIASECTDFIGPAGYGYVQGDTADCFTYCARGLILGRIPASPAQEHVQGPQWWTDYQPVSYTLTSKRGNRTQFANMVYACHAAGVKVIAGKRLGVAWHVYSMIVTVKDTLFNHMAQYESGVGVGGSSFTHYDYPGIYQDQDFHHCGLQPGDQIVDYKNRKEVQTCELNHLAE